MADTVLAQLAALKTAPIGALQAEMARSLRTRAAALQPALPRKPARLSHPGTGLRRAEARDARSGWRHSARSSTAATRRGAGSLRNEPADRRHAADPRMAGRRALRHGARRRLRISGPALQVAVGDRPRHHRHALERAGLLRPQESAEAAHEEADRSESSAARSTPASPPRKAWSRSSTPSMPSARPARPTSPARRPKAGCSCPTTTTTAASRAARWSARPCKRLLADIEASRVDVVVVYKIDRLSRALMDFAKLVEVFDRNSVTFVSVTQSFNTTTSMGRLTLNILLSFAQFEREVIGERIRDKFAASRKQGHVDGRLRAARLRRQGPQAGRQRGRSGDGPHDLRALRQDRLGHHAGAGTARRGRHAANTAS